MSCDECARLRDELERLHRLVPTGTYTLNVPYEEEIQRLKDVGEVLVRSLERMTRERDEALENVKTLQTHVEVLREAHHSASREVERLLAERQALADSAQSVEQNVCALLDLYHSRAVGAEKQAKLAWDRHAEKDAAYGEALRERDKAQEGVAMLREALKAYYHECQCQRRDMDKVNMQAYAALRATDGPEDKP